MHMTCSKCHHRWCWVCGGSLIQVYSHKPNLILYFACDLVYFAPKTLCTTFLFVFLFIHAMVLLPLIVFLVFTAVSYVQFAEKTRYHRLFIFPRIRGCCAIIVFLLLLPYNLIGTYISPYFL